MIVRITYVHDNENCLGDGGTVTEEVEVEGGVFRRVGAPVCIYCFCEFELVRQRLRRRYGEDVDAKTDSMLAKNPDLPKDARW